MTLFMVSFMICGFLLLGKRHVLARSGRGDDHKAVQAAHSRPTLRIGGIGVVASMALALVVFAPEEVRPATTLFSVSLLPTFLAGLAEDLGWEVSPTLRLIWAFVSSCTVMALCGWWITDTGLPGLDWALGFLPLALVWTAIWTSGVCHAFNLIDGVNGFAGTTAVAVALGLAGIAYQAGDPLMVQVALGLVPALLGFLVFNFPLGRIFLGDAGAYTIGHILSWVGIVIALRSPEVAGVSVGLLFFWPVADTFLAMYRRRTKAMSTTRADRMHVHQIVMRGLELGWFGERRRELSNPLTTVILLPLVVFPVVLGVLFWNAPLVSMALIVVLGIVFVWSYLKGVEKIRKTALRRRRLSIARGSAVAAE
ncbi:MraY family glycosyltransferase [Palleronia caenipelagi]|nr:glycosyltransferase [Palleronia caenipelagi]